MADLDRLGTVADFLVPGCFFSEVANALLSGVRRGRMDFERAHGMLECLSDIGFLQDPDIVATARDALMIAMRHSLTVYDASYLAIARRESTPLITLDGAMARAAEAEGITRVRLGE